MRNLQKQNSAHFNIGLIDNHLKDTNLCLHRG